MLEFSKIDKNFSIYKKNDVYLFGASRAGVKVKNILEKNGICVRGVIDNNKEKYGLNFYGTNVISLFDFLEISNKKKNTIIQISSTFEEEIVEQLENNKISNYIFYTEFVSRVSQLGRYLVADKNNDLKKWFYESDWTRVFLNTMNDLQSFYLEKKELTQLKTFDIMLSPPKVGNDAIFSSLKGIDKYIINLRHSYKLLDRNVWEALKGEKLRLVMGVREPIKQNLSIMFEISGNEFWDLDEFWVNGGDVQKIFDNYILGNNDSLCWYNLFKKKMHYNYLVQDFFEQQLKPFLGIDIYEYPFNKDSGYSIYHFDNIDIFIYQIEKISNIFGELMEFLSVDGAELSKTNDAKSKWYNEYYNKAQKDIIISKKYFEECYSGKYIKHFYNDDDIKSFKHNWRRNVG